jgi:hypothetical protein
MDRVSPDKSRLRAAFYWAGNPIAALKAPGHAIRGLKQIPRQERLGMTTLIFGMTVFNLAAKLYCSRLGTGDHFIGRGWQNEVYVAGGVGL